jgi:N-formylglutamate deformylase
VTLPIALSVPHAGLSVPEEVGSYCQLTDEQIRRDGDEEAAAIYDLRREVAEFASTDVARAIVDLNRATDDRRPDGVVKSITIWQEPIYRRPLPEPVIDQLIDRYYRPYHARLTSFATPRILFAVDCHTMAASGPPIGPDPGKVRPHLCLGDCRGRSLPPGWMTCLARCFGEFFAGFQVAVNEPFSGGYITRRHAQEMPWVQLEISRAPFLSAERKRARVIESLGKFVELLPTLQTRRPVE